jgi:hypothetical protein
MPVVELSLIDSKSEVYLFSNEENATMIRETVPRKKRSAPSASKSFKQFRPVSSMMLG